LNIKRLQECRSAALITLHRLEASDGIECDAIVSIEHRVTDPADGRRSFFQANGIFQIAALAHPRGVYQSSIFNRLLESGTIKSLNVFKCISDDCPTICTQGLTYLVGKLVLYFGGLIAQRDQSACGLMSVVQRPIRSLSQSIRFGASTLGRNLVSVLLDFVKLVQL
jgi:hypothetical protein